jgi:hypothetical protein
MRRSSADNAGKQASRGKVSTLTMHLSFTKPINRVPEEVS